MKESFHQTGFQFLPKILRISTTLRFVTAENRTLPARTIGRQKLFGAKFTAYVAGLDESI